MRNNIACDDKIWFGGTVRQPYNHIEITTVPKKLNGKRKISRTWITSRDPGYYFFALKTNSWTEPRKFTVQS